MLTRLKGKRSNLPDIKIKLKVKKNLALIQKLLKLNLQYFFIIGGVPDIEAMKQIFPFKGP